MSKSYIVIQQYWWCNEKGHGVEYTTDGVIEGGKLVSFDWMNEPVGESAETLAEIAEAIGYEGTAQ
ncbi:TPA: antitoxin [Escherichia coli]